MSNDSSNKRQKTAFKALEAAVARSPKRSRFGFFARDDFAGGAGGFHWYGTEAELCQALVRDLAPAFIEDEADADVDQIAEGVEQVLARFPDQMRFSAECCEALCETLRGVQVVEWIGTIQDLCNSELDFARELRESFRELSDMDDEGEAVRLPGRPIASAELEDFIEFIKEYGF
jgi:hypothetical protein